MEPNGPVASYLGWNTTAKLGVRFGTMEEG